MLKPKQGATKLGDKRGEEYGVNRNISFKWPTPSTLSIFCCANNLIILITYIVNLAVGVTSSYQVSPSYAPLGSFNLP